MNKTVLLLLSCLIFLSCSHEKSNLPPSIDYLPANGFALLQINNFSAFTSDLKNNHFLNSFRDAALYKSISQKLTPLQYLQSNGKVLLGFYPVSPDSTTFVLVAPSNPDLFRPDEASDFSQETLTFKDRELIKFTFGSQPLFAMRTNDQLLLSPSDSLLQVAAGIPAAFEKDPGFMALFATANPERNASLFTRLPRAAEALGNLFPSETRLGIRRFTDWISLDFSSRQDYLSLNGLTVPNDSLPNVVNLFREMRPMPLQTPTFAPETATAVLAFALDDFHRFALNREAFDSGPKAMDTIMRQVEELGFIQDQTGDLAILHTYGSDPITTALRGYQRGSEDYRDHEIFSLDKDMTLLNCLTPLLGSFTAHYYTVLENALVFSENRNALTHLIDQYSLESTFDKTALYQAAKESLADESNVLLVASQKGLEHLLEKDLGERMLQALKEAGLSEYSFSAQLVAEGSFYHTTFMMRRLGDNSPDRGAVPRYTVQLDAPLSMAPQFVTNHRTGKEEVVVQDENNTLYLISTDGKVLWKKHLDGPIQGAIAQVDLYKNGRLQMAFTTDNHFIILDRNGKEVAPFEMTFPGGNLNPLAVFDYEGNRDYRFVVTQGERLFMYNNRGKIVSGFTYTKADAPILPSPQHIRFGNKDYLVLRLENGHLEILDRVGHIRVRVSETIDFSGNGVYAYNNQFALTDKQGTLFLIDEKGKITKNKYKLGPEHGMDATSKTMAFMNENILTIKGHEVSLDYGLYTAPRIFYIYDTIYVAVTDLQSHRAYLFNSSGEAIPGFPVSGSSPADLVDMDHDHTLEMVVKGQDDSLIVYHINR